MAAVAIAIGAGCDGKRAEEPGARGADCAAVRDLGARSVKRWTDLGEASPAADAPLADIAKHTAELARTAKAIGEEFDKSAPKTGELGETAEGVRMLGALAGKNLAAYAETLGALDKALPGLGKLEGAANDVSSAALGEEALASVGCGDKKPSKECGEVAARMADLERPAATGDFAQAAQASRARADGLDAVAKAVAALPPAPPKQKARDEEVRKAREGAEAFRALAKALDAVAPVQARLGSERAQAEEAAMRFTAEIQAASALCPPADAGKPAASASAAAARSAAPAGSAAPVGSAR
jgi:hypothetical protein